MQRADPAAERIAGNSALLVSLLENLLGNAVKSRRDDVAPEVVVERRARRTGSGRSSVRDNGIGIDPQYGERIFAVFQRLHLRDQYGGTGIGLALCRKIVEFHGGWIWLDEAASSLARFRPSARPSLRRCRVSDARCAPMTARRPLDVPVSSSSRTIPPTSSSPRRRCAPVTSTPGSSVVPGRRRGARLPAQGERLPRRRASGSDPARPQPAPQVRHQVLAEVKADPVLRTHPDRRADPRPTPRRT